VGQVLAAEPEKLKVILIDGQNNHDWRKTPQPLVSPRIPA